MAFLALTRRALSDIDEIERYSAEQWGRKVAAQYLKSIEQALDLLREQPGLLRTKPEVSDHLAFYRVKQHFLVCALEGENVYVLTVVHGSMDLPERVAELEPTLEREAATLHRSFLAGRER